MLIIFIANQSEKPPPPYHLLRNNVIRLVENRTKISIKVFSLLAEYTSSKKSRMDEMFIEMKMNKIQAPSGGIFHSYAVRIRIFRIFYNHFIPTELFYCAIYNFVIVPVGERETLMGLYVSQPVFPSPKFLM